MPWQRETLQTIHDRMKADAESRLTGGVKIPRFSLLGVLLITLSGALHLMYGFLFYMSKQLFVDTAEKWFLDRHARKYGLPRKAATYAEGAVQFVGTIGVVISAGTKVQNSEGSVYSTISEVTLDAGGLGQSDIQADVAGVAGNTDETELQLETPIAGVQTAVQVTLAPNGGEDLETDDALRARLLQRIQNPPASGNAADYIRWAGEVAGVGKSWVLSAEDYKGAGSVAVFVSTASLDPVGATIKQNVIDNIEEKRPLKAEADVLDVVTVELKMYISISPNTQEFRTAIDKNMTAHLLNEASPGGTVLISGLRSAISASGVPDYKITDMEIDGVPVAVDDIPLGAFEVCKYDQSVYAGL